MLCWSCSKCVGFTESVRAELKHKRLPIHLCQVHLPATNTPQFDWVPHRGIRHHPRPVPPIFQPEIAARAIAHMAEHPRRAMWVGSPTAVTILANRLVPGLVARYLAHTNVQAQQSPDQDPRPRQANTWKPLPGDAGAHGSFDDTAHAHSPQAWLSRHRTSAITAVALAAGVAWQIHRRR